MVWRARALMLEAMHHAAELGAFVIDVLTGSADSANALYESLPFALGWVSVRE